MSDLICHHRNVMNNSCLFRQYTDFITRKHKPTITNTTNKKINLKYIYRILCINLTLLHYSVLVSVILLHDLLTFDLPAKKNWRCFSAELYLCIMIDRAPFRIHQISTTLLNINTCVTISLTGSISTDFQRALIEYSLLGRCSVHL